MDKRLTKDKKNGMIFGVCSGLGRYTGIDPVIVRMGFVLATLFGGGGLIVYVIAALIMPKE